ncbi:GNAT family N-acetyltransferase [Saccharothrix variisporea]|uniref:GNAT family N-acetyltransferase n=1 Tax=Saccharothrix variisporea TaxID=543527 RepID=UPI000EB16378|nr:GNAT family N-acetyltransferase [Saccharothrix variisporea]
MDDIEVRAARPEELPAVAALRWRWTEEVHGSVPMPRAEFAARFAAWAADHTASHRCSVAVRDGEVLGMAWLGVVVRVPHPRSFDRASGDLQCVYVTPAERGRGLAGRLVGDVLAAARELGLERMTVHSSTQAVPGYVRAGFAVSPVLLQLDLREAPPTG